MNTIFQLTLSGIILIISTLFVFHFANPSSPITSDGFVHAPPTLNLLRPDETIHPHTMIVKEKRKDREEGM